MRLQLAAIAALIITPAYAHSGHTETVAGHTHTISDLVAMGAGFALLAVAGLAIVVFLTKRRND